MDMSLREWLLLLGAVILIGILLDGYRRMQRAKRDNLEMSRHMGGLGEADGDLDFNPELPGGGARVVRREEPRESAASVRRSDTGGFEADPEVDGLTARRHEPDFDELDDALVAESEQPAPASKMTSPRFPEAVKVVESPQAAPAPAPVEQPRKTVSETVADASSRVQSMAAAAKNLLKKDQVEPAKSSGAAEKKPLEIIVINVLSKEEEGFDGSRLRRLVEACGMEPDQQSVFVRYEHGFGAGPVQFGMANRTERGTFDLDAMDTDWIKGVCFYLSLPGPDDSMKAFEYMLETAQCVVRNLNGDLKDERGSVFTQQTIEHCRQRIREFERRQQLAARV